MHSFGALNLLATTQRCRSLRQCPLLWRLAAYCKALRNQYRGGRANAQRLRALVQLLRFLRIRDAVTLSRERIVNGKLLLYTAKTGTPVHIPLPEFVVEGLEMARGTNPQFYFWSGEGKQKSCVGDWQRSLKKLFRLAGVPDGHAHRFRHTFASSLLLAGVPLDRVATLLGHTNSKITEEALRALDSRTARTA